MKSQKLYKFQKSSKFRKNLLKSENSPKFSANKAKSNFLTSNNRENFNYLRLACIKVSIL